MTEVKKTTLTKLFALLLAMMMVLPMVVACKAPEEKPPVADNQEEDKIEGDIIYLGERGHSSYSLVYSTDAKVLTKTECKNLVDEIRALTEANITIVEDASRLTKREIIVGVVGEIGRADVEKEVAKYNIGKYDYLIKTWGANIIIALGCKEMSIQAFALLKERLLIIDKDNQTVAIPKDLEYAYYDDNASDKNGAKKVRVDAKNPTELLFTLHPGSELDVPARIVYTGNGGWRVQTKYSLSEPFSNVGAAQKLALDLGYVPTDLPQQLTYWEDDENVIAQAADGSYAVLNKKSFNIKFCNAKGELVRHLTAMNHTITGRLDTLTLFATFALNDTEAIFGAGESFESINRRGEKFAVQSGAVADNRENSNVAIPLFSSSRGSGIFMNSNAYR